MIIRNFKKLEITSEVIVVYPKDNNTEVLLNNEDIDNFHFINEVERSPAIMLEDYEENVLAKYVFDEA